MELDQFLEKDVLKFIDSRVTKKSRVSVDREEEYGLYLIKDYHKELRNALENDEIAKAKKLFEELKETYAKLPKNSPEKEKIYGTIEGMYKDIQEYIAMKNIKFDVTTGPGAAGVPSISIQTSVPSSALDENALRKIIREEVHPKSIGQSPSEPASPEFAMSASVMPQPVGSEPSFSPMRTQQRTHEQERQKSQKQQDHMQEQREHAQKHAREREQKHQQEQQQFMAMIEKKREMESAQMMYRKRHQELQHLIHESASKARSMQRKIDMTDAIMHAENVSDASSPDVPSGLPDHIETLKKQLVELKQEKTSAGQRLKELKTFAQQHADNPQIVALTPMIAKKEEELREFNATINHLESSLSAAIRRIEQRHSIATQRPSTIHAKNEAKSGTKNGAKSETKSETKGETKGETKSEYSSDNSNLKKAAPALIPRTTPSTASASPVSAGSSRNPASSSFKISRRELAMLYEEGIYQLYNQHYEQAVTLFEKLIELRPQNKAARIRLQECRDAINETGQDTGQKEVAHG